MRKKYPPCGLVEDVFRPVFADSFLGSRAEGVEYVTDSNPIARGESPNRTIRMGAELANAWRGSQVTDANVTERRARQTVPTQRLNVNISTTAMNTLAELATANGISMTEAVRRAIQLLKLVEDATHEGRQVQLVDPETKQVQTLRFI